MIKAYRYNTNTLKIEHNRYFIEVIIDLVKNKLSKALQRNKKNYFY